MKKYYLLLAVALTVASTSGCGQCRNWFGWRSRPLATMVTPGYTTYSPGCCYQGYQSCGMPSCDSCGCEGEIMYGGDANYAPMEADPTPVPAGTTYGQ